MVYAARESAMVGSWRVGRRVGIEEEVKGRENFVDKEGLDSQVWWARVRSSGGRRGKSSEAV